MTGRTVLVTGAARGIGAEVARRLAADGARVVALDRCSDDPRLDYRLGGRAQLEAVAADCGNGSVAVVADVTDRDALADALSEGLRPSGGVGATDGGAFDAVVCAAGVVWGGPPIWDTPVDLWHAVMNTNTLGVLNTAALTIPGMVGAAGTPVADRGRRFVVIASAAADRGLARMGAYAASKAAAVSMVRSMAADLAGSGVTVNAVSPGSTDTDVLAASAGVYGLETPQELARHHTNGRLLTPEEIADGVAWLCSAGASGVTGAVIPVDGGMTAT